MPRGDRLIKAMKTVGKKVNPTTEQTDIMYGVVQKVSPLTVLVDNRLELTEEFLILSPFCYSTGFKINIADHSHEVSVSKISASAHTHTVEGKETSSAGGFSSTPKASCSSAGGHSVKVSLWGDLEIGDKLVMLRVSQGQEYLVLYRDRLDIKVST